MLTSKSIQEIPSGSDSTPRADAGRCAMAGAECFDMKYAK